MLSSFNNLPFSVHFNQEAGTTLKGNVGFANIMHEGWF